MTSRSRKETAALSDVSDNRDNLRKFLHRNCSEKNPDSSDNPACLHLLRGTSPKEPPTDWLCPPLCPTAPVRPSYRDRTPQKAHRYCSQILRAPPVRKCSVSGIFFRCRDYLSAVSAVRGFRR